MQVPAPEIPPIFVSTGGPPTEIIIFGILAATVILWPLVRALARRLEHKGVGDAAHIEELEARVAELEDRQLRMGELEERMEFAERLLAQQREQSKLGP
jgi:hypothetical protein